MHAAIRPRFASGVALATAGIIAVTPVVATPQTTAAPAVTASTVLTAIENPFPLWEAINRQVISSFEELARDYLSRPAPILTQIARNQVQSASELAAIATEYIAALGTSLWETPEKLGTVIADLRAGDASAAVRQLTEMAQYPVTLSKWALGESFPILVRPIDRLIAVAAASPGALTMVVDAVMVAASTFIMAAVGTVDDAWHALKKQNVDGVINAVLTGAAVVPATALGLVAAPIQGWIQASRFLAKAVATTEGQPHDPVTPTLGLRKASLVTVDVVTESDAPAVEKVSAGEDSAAEEPAEEPVDEPAGDVRDDVTPADEVDEAKVDVADETEAADEAATETETEAGAAASEPAASTDAEGADSAES